MNDLPDLARKFSRAAQDGRGIRLSAAELDLLFAVGANDVLQSEASKYLRNQCLRRSAQTRSISGGHSGSIGIEIPPESSDPPSSPSFGMIQSGDAGEALQRAKRALRRERPGSMPSISKKQAGKRSAQHAGDRSSGKAARS
jgi:hypothetical protein